MKTISHSVDQGYSGASNAKEMLTIAKHNETSNALIDTNTDSNVCPLKRRKVMPPTEGCDPKLASLQIFLPHEDYCASKVATAKQRKDRTVTKSVSGLPPAGTRSKMKQYDSVRNNTFSHPTWPTSHDVVRLDAEGHDPKLSKQLELMSEKSAPMTMRLRIFQNQFNANAMRIATASTNKASHPLQAGTHLKTKDVISADAIKFPSCPPPPQTGTDPKLKHIWRPNSQQNICVQHQNGCHPKLNPMRPHEKGKVGSMEGHNALDPHTEQSLPPQVSIDPKLSRATAKLYIQR